MTDGVEEAVNTTVLQNSGGVGGFQFFITEIFSWNDADGIEDVGGVNAVAGTRVTEVNGLALDVFNGLDVGGRLRQPRKSRLPEQERKQRGVF